MKDITSNPNGSPKQPLPSKPGNVQGNYPDLHNCKDKSPNPPSKDNLVDTSGYKTLPSPVSGDQGDFHNK